MRLANVWLRRLAGAAPGSSEDLELYQRWEPRGGQEIVVVRLGGITWDTVRIVR